MNKQNIFDTLDKFAKTDIISVLHFVHEKINETDDASIIVKNLNYVNIHVNESIAYETRKDFNLYFSEYNPDRFLKVKNNPFTLHKTISLLDKYGIKKAPHYQYSNINQFIKDSGYDKDLVWAIFIDRIRYRAGVFSNLEETFFPYTEFSFNTSLDALNDEIRALPEYEAQKALTEVIISDMIDFSIKSEPIPF